MILAKSAIEMCFGQEHQSFLVPAYGFEEYKKGIEYWGKIDMHTGSVFTPVSGPDKLYVPHASFRHSRWYTTALLGNTAERREDKNEGIWDVLRSKDTPKPISAYNVALLVHGPRKFFRTCQKTDNGSKRQHRVAEGEKYCFATWGRKDDPRIGCFMFIDETTRILVARSGRGVLYSREIGFDNENKPSGFCHHLICVEFTIYDHNPEKDDMLRVKIVRTTSWSENPHFPESVDKVWNVLIKRARAGFERWCKLM